jgi:hypothetical protein
MNTRLLLIAPLVALSACGASDPADDPVRFDCGDTDVIVNREQANALLAGSGENVLSLGASVCAAFAGVDASTFTEPREVAVLMPNGAQVMGQVQASQQ